jgi:hypothetical protein
MGERAQCIGSVLACCAAVACGGGSTGKDATRTTSPDATAPCVAPACAAATSDAPGASDDSSTVYLAGDAQAEGGSGVPPPLPSPTLPPVPVGNLVFGAFGDIRPANPNDTAGYPDAILRAIFSGLQAQGISVAVDGGDHCFQMDTSSGSYCHDQFINHFMADMKGRYTGRLFPTMGNHEGCGMYAATAGNCTTWTSGLVQDYLIDIVQPTTGQSSSPYYSVVLYGSWGTAKLVHVAANAWTAGQGTWLADTLNVATTYTFVVRHEPNNDTRAPGVTPSESMFASHFGRGTLTLSITGHTHLIQLPGGTRPYGDRYGATKAYEMIVGNAGAPLDAGSYYGYAVLRRRTVDGAIVVQAHEAMAADGVTPLHDAPDPNFLFAVNADGTSNPQTSFP